ncbi:hypothetical protein K1T71_010997 [Dendrolimus kikuchii]|uniref:Uncharacterized protein n=1 Tax=Dendrolimus kikuchii TaxID=765133 RepID=A0ACC1CQL5_9NEOP|nr:hypothetical protein K1T71_010997 [Dendrolimus kikuchii]
MIEDPDDDESLEGSSIINPGIYVPIKRGCRQISPRTPTRRYVFKNGDINIEKFKPRPEGFFISWFLSMINARWRWTLLNFFTAFTANWLFFGFVYWITALVHGDLREDHLPNGNTTWVPCIKNIYGFTSTFLFSVEVHTTVAYGKRAITLECPQTIIAMCLQCIVSSFFQAILVGILFAKLTRPKARTQTILFSKQAVVTLRNNQLCLMYRVGDMRKSRILNIKASLFILKLDLDDHCINDFEQLDLNVHMDGCESTFFLWPVSVIHVIDEFSPLYKMSATDLLCGKIEMLAVFEGVIESTGQPVQAKASYSENEILWGHRFVHMIQSHHKKDVYGVDFSKLSDTEQVDTPLCSAWEYSLAISLYNLSYL